ncbi:MAG: ACT domain-containing protein [Anaerolineae bacterium]|uniref:ACT domain-containing protein n=1 Tax=Candidatus Amarolinea dominans TaxID=3140696 RepID=UPI0031346AD1|nr:ACT domain-containing protein [Anaerolineae bacterium]MBK9231030.1 ACT domain-containing protein [Anaerolineae bacterium]
MNIKTRIGGILKNSTLARISVIGLPDRPGMAAMILGALGNAHINVEFIIQCIDLNQQDHFVLCIERDDLSAALRVVEAATREVRARSIVHDGRAASIAIFGPDFRERPGIAATMFQALAQAGINIEAISTSISTVTCIISEAHLPDALAAIQRHFDVPG